MLQRSLEDDVGELHAEPGAAGGRVPHVHQQVMKDHAGLPTVHTLYTIHQILFKLSIYTNNLFFFNLAKTGGQQFI
jgi:hypothetical protein